MHLKNLCNKNIYITYKSYNDARFAQETNYLTYINFIILSKPIAIINMSYGPP